MRALVVGLGSIGRRHVRNLKQIDPAIQVVVWRRASNADGLADTALFIDRVVTSFDEILLARPDAAIVANPAPLHVETGLMLAREGVPLFIEKPLSNTLDGVHALLDLCRQRSLLLMTGYNFRFYKPLQILRQALVEGRIGRVMTLRAEVGQFLPEWRPTSQYRDGISGRQELGGGVVLELSHELDYVRWLIGEVGSVSAQVGQLSDLEIDVEDVAEIVLRFANGAIGSVHLDMVQRPATRSCRIIGTGGALTWDWAHHRVQWFSADTGSWSDLYLEENLDPNEMYIEELRHFLDCLQKRAVPVVSAEDGRRALEIALAVKRSSEEKRLVEV